MFHTSSVLQEDIIINHNSHEMETELDNRTGAPSISVQIRRSSILGKVSPSDRFGRGSSTDKLGRGSSREPFKRGSSSGQFVRTPSRDTFERMRTRSSQRSSHLPKIAQQDLEARRSYTVSSRKSKNSPSKLARLSTETSVDSEWLRAISSRQKEEEDAIARQLEILEAENEAAVIDDETELKYTLAETVIHGKHPGSIHLPDVHIPESAKSQGSGITGLSTFSKDRTKSGSRSTKVSSAKNLSEMSSVKKSERGDTSGSYEVAASGTKHLTEKPVADSSLEVYQTTPFINEDDGLDHSVFPVYPALNNLYDPKLKTGVPPRVRPLAGRKRVPFGQLQMNLSDGASGRPGSGHLRYHHRNDEDSVPYPGFEIPPTPTEEEIAEFERLEEERLANELVGELNEEEKRQLEIMIAEGKVFDTERSSRPFTDDSSLILSENDPSVTIRSLSGPDNERIVNDGRARSFCRCPSDVRREESNLICKHCGRHVHSEHKSRSGAFESEFPFSRSMGAPSRTSREKMLNDHKLAQPVRTQTMSDEDYMDLESIIQDDDARYWSSDDDNEGTSHATTTSSLRRLRNAKPYPLVDPDLHKQVYLQALNEAQNRDIKKGNGGRFDEFRKLRRPNVFSYYQLWPFAGKCNGCGNDLGIRPDQGFAEKKPKQGQLMKHIFGDVKVEDYYPGGSKSSDPKIVLDSMKTGDRSMTKSIDASVINSSKKIKRQGILFASKL